jgi:hypothetical protein
VALAVTPDVVTLNAVRVTGDRRCLVRPQEGLDAARLWEEARKALDATRLTQMAQAAARRTGNRFTLRLRRLVRELDPGSLAERKRESYDREVESATPYVSAEPSKLAQLGYVIEDNDGFVYFAPDAVVFLSNEFLDTHCLRVERPGRGADALIGLAFEPVKSVSRSGARHVDVEGVLWLDRATAELRYMEYRYTDLNLAVSTDALGGHVDFRPLPDGRWIVWRWYIRMPQLTRKRVSTAEIPGASPEWRTALLSIREEGGEVLEVLPPGSRVARTASLAGTVTDSLRGKPLASGRVFLSGTSYQAVTDGDGRYQIDSIPPGAYTVSLLEPRLDTLLIEPPARRLTLSAGEDARLDFGLPSFKSLVASLCPGTDVDPLKAAIIGIVRDTSGARAAGVSVVARWESFGKTNDRLTARQNVADITSAADGRFALCGLPADSRILLSAKYGNLTSEPFGYLLLGQGEVRRGDLSLKARR